MNIKEHSIIQEIFFLKSFVYFSIPVYKCIDYFLHSPYDLFIFAISLAISSVILEGIAVVVITIKDKKKEKIFQQVIVSKRNKIHFDTTFVFGTIEQSFITIMFSVIVLIYSIKK